MTIPVRWKQNLSTLSEKKMLNTIFAIAAVPPTTCSTMRDSMRHNVNLVTNLDDPKPTSLLEAFPHR